jgi:hypothetical protein
MTKIREVLRGNECGGTTQEPRLRPGPFPAGAQALISKQTLDLSSPAAAAVTKKAPGEPSPEAFETVYKPAFVELSAYR